MEKLVVVAAISVFWAVKVKNEGLVPALLANVYNTLHLRLEKKGGLLLYCIPLLYQWFVSHVFKDVDTIEGMDGYEWPQTLVGLTENAIIWYPHGLNMGDTITSYGEFPNVPLIGSKGCINYNPVLAVRQLCYPITYKSDDQLLEGLSKPGKKFASEDKTIVGDREPYYQWVTKRSQEINLPFILDPPTQPPPPEPTHVSIEEAKVLKATIARIRRENEELQISFQQVSNERNEMKWELERKKAQLEATEEKVDKEEHKRKKVKVGMEQADLYLETIKAQLKQVKKECPKNKRWWLRATEEKREVRETLEAKIHDLTISPHNAET
ncbi:uncharacterized protein LOC127131616 [Lathyrus oleraceus]|uniref:uncharacterized protein LOC127131616 n=1 Tax=Pisum sativum TaxID=3888 RepID=UPI0021D2A13F|nr:uncharacterized protein LOC127131616 [Pisum sativum]